MDEEQDRDYQERDYVAARDEVEAPASPAPRDRRPIVAAMVLLCVVAVSLAYAWRESHDAFRLAVDKDRVTASLNQALSQLDQTRSQIDAMQTRLNALTLASLTPPAETTAGEPARTVGAPARAEASRSTTHTLTRRRALEDPRWKKLQAQLAEQQNQINATQQQIEKTRGDLDNKLSSTRDELNGSIARNHEELVALQKRGERNYYEFDLTKSKQFRGVGSMSLSLRKVNTKHDNYNLVATVDDFQLSKKNVNLYEPVFFYPEGSQQPLELVVNRIDKDHVHGYVSEPKYKAAELASASSAGATVVPAANAAGTTSEPASASKESLGAASGNSSAPSEASPSLPHRPSDQL